MVDNTEKHIKEQVDAARAAMVEFGKRFDSKDIQAVKRRALRPMVHTYRKKIKDLKKDFVVYRNGAIYAVIKPGTLRESMGIITTSKNKDYMAVGPRVNSGEFKDPDKGGWFAHFLNFGGLIGGVPYRGKNYRFAEKAAKSGRKNVYLVFRKEIKKRAELIKKELRIL